MKLLVTGGAGFIGSNFILYWMKKYPLDKIVNLDSLTYAGNLENLITVEKNPNYSFIHGDITNPIQVNQALNEVDIVVHFAAESHVDRSISDPSVFLKTNVIGTQVLLEASLKNKIKRFHHVSTDEVFGPMENGTPFKEWDRYKSSNPYAASKAGGEEMAYSFFNTYKLPIIITHTMNVFGERQHPEKFIPLCISKVLNGEIIPIHADKTKIISGSRFWIHARNVFEALLFVNEKGVAGEKYNIVGEKEVSNLEMAKFIADVLGKELKYEMMDFHSSRPGHDLRYGLNGEKLEKMGLEYPKTFNDSLKKVILWSLENKKWLQQ